MSSSQASRSAPSPAPDPTAEETAVARRRLAALDAGVFAEALPVSPIQQNDLIRRAVRKLFGHGL